MLLCSGALRVILSFAPPEARFFDFPIDIHILGLTAALIVLTGILSGLGPSLSGSRTDVAGQLKLGGRPHSGGAQRASFRSALVVGQLAITFAAMIVCGAMIRSYGLLAGADPGFETKTLLTFRGLSPADQYEPDDAQALKESILRRLEALPSVVSVSLGTFAPPHEAQWNRRLVFLSQGGQAATVACHPVGPRYLQTVGLDLLQGRGLEEFDVMNAPWVAVVNAELARRFFPAGNAVGKVLEFEGEGERPRQIVGVVSDTLNRGVLRDPAPLAYVPLTQQASESASANPRRQRGHFLLRTSGDPASIAAAVRREVADLDPRQAVTHVQTIEAQLDAGASEMLVGVFILVPLVSFALMLSAAGVYGVLAYVTTQRTHEFGIRMALGADPAEIRRLVLRQGLLLASIGAGLGALVALAATRAFSAVILPFQSADGTVFVATLCLVLGTALLATLAPAARATRIDPVNSLGHE